MPLIALRDVSLSLGSPVLLEHLDLALDSGERVCLVGRNGEGKTTLLRVLSGEIAPDDGAIQSAPDFSVATLPQTFPTELPRTVHELVAQGLGPLGDILNRLRTAAPAEQPRLEAEVNRLEGWDGDRQCVRWCDAAGIDPNMETRALSGGQLRRALLARALVPSPRVLILDEPTNHLDLPSIDWLEKMIDGFSNGSGDNGPGAVIFTTHDRAFLRRIATRIVELDRGQLTSWPGDYANFLRRREERNNAEQKASERFSKLLNEEERWIRKGIMARRTRNEGRVRRLAALRDERKQRRTRTEDAQFTVQAADPSGRRVIAAEEVSFEFEPGSPLVSGFSCIVQRGDKLGVIGPNGVGKTTLIRLLLGELTPDSGSVELGPRLEVAYFDQRREQLNNEARVIDCIGEGSDHVTVNGESRHVISYLQDFLFTPDRVRGPVKVLSGGERNRLLLARLFSRPSNFLVFDEPTNDLDVETLELLEELLIRYKGTIVIVSHDREFLDNVVTSTLVFEGAGKVVEYVGGYSDYISARPDGKLGKSDTSRVATTQTREKPPPQPSRRARGQKLSYRERRELEVLPAKIEALEQAVENLQRLLADPELYRKPNQLVAQHTAALKDAEGSLERSYERWAALDASEA